MNRADQSTSAGSAEVEIRHCHNLAEYEQCVELERIIWGERIAVPSTVLLVAQHTGGQVLGAFVAEQLIGFSLSFRGHRQSQTYLHSHMTAVLPAYHNQGIGRKLKLFQRQDALNRSVTLAEWTFDPLELKNAHFNFVRLGAVSRRFIPNFYGLTDSKLDAGLPTDRLVAEWWLDSPRVQNILAGHAPSDQPTELRIITVPSNLTALKVTDRQAAVRIQSAAREQFQKYFAEGYVATGIRTRGDSTEYILQPAASIAGLRLPEYRPEEFED